MPRHPQRKQFQKIVLIPKEVQQYFILQLYIWKGKRRWKRLSNPTEESFLLSFSAEEHMLEISFYKFLDPMLCKIFFVYYFIFVKSLMKSYM